ncbi:MAG: class I SAM-dependent methyltransferase [Micrococcales bacterium]
MGKPLGNITRGTTNPNRLRRVDRFIAALPIASRENLLAVDLGFGASPITAIELLARLRDMNPSARVVGIEIDRERVERGKPHESDSLAFMHGGFETPLPAKFGERADLIRALNVLRQYDEHEVRDAWAKMQSRLSDGGILVEGTCDEIGRVSCWVVINSEAPVSLTISLRLLGLDAPSKVAERLPKVLIHRNVPGEKIHDYLNALDVAWRNHSALGVFSPVQRWVAVCRDMKAAGWPIATDSKRWRLGEITVDWDAVAPKP